MINAFALARRLSALCLIGVALALPHARAAEPLVSNPAQGLELDAAALRSLIGQPPASGSQQAAVDLAILLWLQRFRTPAMEADAWWLLDRNPALFSRAVGADLSKSAPLLRHGITAFLRPIDAIKDTIKDQISRPRPFVHDASIHNCLPRETSASFPSGHATWYRAAAELLADVLPERREPLLAVGLHGGASRVICGVHYPSDVEAGQRLGLAAAQQVIRSDQWRAFLANPAVQQELRELRAAALNRPVSRSDNRLP